MSDTIKQDVIIINKRGLHVRAAAKLVALAARFSCEIRLIKGTRQANAKSIMGVMMLGAPQGTPLQIHACGEDAEQALARLIELIQQRFEEDE